MSNGGGGVLFSTANKNSAMTVKAECSVQTSSSPPFTQILVSDSVQSPNTSTILDWRIHTYDHKYGVYRSIT